MRNVQLPLAEPPINGLMYLANPLAILFNNNECLPWFYSEYVQLLWDKKVNFLYFHNKFISEFPTCIPWLEFQCMDKKFITNNIDIHKLIINAINDGWYIFSAYDEFYIPNMYAYQNYHVNHDFMLYGYDLDKQEYYTNIYTKKGILEPNIISFNQFCDGFFANVSFDFEFNRINLYKMKQSFNYEFDKRSLLEELHDYLNSTCSNIKFSLPRDHSDCIFGMDVYCYILDIFQLHNDSIKDLKFLHLLWEHKKCMQSRVVYMINNNIINSGDFLVEMFSEIESIALCVKNLQIKLKISNDLIICDKIVQNLKLLYDKEKLAIETLIRTLERA
jgi:hypothetical protein